MEPATRLKEIARNLYGWSSFHTQWKIDFDSYAIKTPDGIVLVDPLKPTPAVLKKLEALGEFLGIYLTNAHHDRDADWFRKQYGIQVYAHEKAKSDCDTKIDVLVMDGEKLPGGVRAVHLPGSSASEMALFVKVAGGVVLLGDALLNQRDKGLALLPDQYMEDHKQAVVSLRKLLDLDFKIATFAHGDPVTADAKKRIAAFLKKPKKNSS
jgi:hypothetical protein